ncbi:MAG: hypothetical protein IT329_17580, partial [Caldilineaceae bacterium]|nr:hypothetical protein [Caldilineaceae bacterium]
MDSVHVKIGAETERPTASVIIPVWNGAADLPACLDALLAQTGVGFTGMG